MSVLVTDPSKKQDSRYPRPRVIRLLLATIKLWWLAFLIYPGNVIFNFYSLIAHQGLGGFKDFNAISQALLIDRLIPLFMQEPLVIIPLAIILIILIVAGRWAHLDGEREREELLMRQEQSRRKQERLEMQATVENAARTAAEKHLTSLRSATSALYEPQGPPFDESLLVRPEQFVGRSQDLDWLLDRLRNDKSANITAIRGMGGIGKTALAAVAVQQVHHEGLFADGIAVILCEGLTDAAFILQRALTRFDPYRRQQGGTDDAELMELSHELLDQKRVLIVFDNVEPELDIERVLSPLHAAGATILITARQTLSSTIIPLSAVRTLELLSPEYALDLFAQSLGYETGSDLKNGKRKSAQLIVAALGYHTLAIRVVGRYAADLQRDLPTLAIELQNPQEALELPEGETPNYVEQVLAKSVESLNDETHRLFAALGAFATAELGRQAIISLAKGLGLSNPEASITLLVRRSLIDTTIIEEMPEGARERLHLHPLLRAYSSEEFSHWLSEEADLAQLAIARFYAEYVNIVTEDPLSFDEINIIGGLEWAQKHQQREIVAAIDKGMLYYWRDRGHTSASLKYLPWGVDAVQTLLEKKESGDIRSLAADLTYGYAMALRDTGQYDAADQVFSQSLQFHATIDNALGKGFVLTDLAQMIKDRGKLSEAESLLEQALSIFRQQQNAQGESDALLILGQIQRRRGLLAIAGKHYQRSLDLRQETHDKQGEGWVLTYLGELAQVQERFLDAEDSYNQVLMLGKIAPNARRDALVLDWLGQVELSRGKIQLAEDYFARALDLDIITKSRREEGMIYNYTGRIAQLRGQIGEATTLYDKALAIVIEVQDPQGEAIVRWNVGTIASHLGDTARAEQEYRHALTLLRETDDIVPYAEMALDFSTFLLEQSDQRDEGCALLAQTIEQLVHLQLPGIERARQLQAKNGC